MPPTLPPHLLRPKAKQRVLLLPGPGGSEWLRWSGECAGQELEVRCLDLWAAGLRRAEAVAVFVAFGLLAAVAGACAAGLKRGHAALLVAAAAVAGLALGALLLRRCAQLACAAATDAASSAAAEFRPDLLVGHSFGAWVAFRLRDRCAGLLVVAPPDPMWCAALGVDPPQGIDAIARALDRGTGVTPQLLEAAKVPVRLVEEAPTSAAGLRRLLGQDDARDSDSEGMCTAASRGPSVFDECASEASEAVRLNI